MIKPEPCPQYTYIAGRDKDGVNYERTLSCEKTEDDHMNHMASTVINFVSLDIYW